MDFLFTPLLPWQHILVSHCYFGWPILKLSNWFWLTEGGPCLSWGGKGVCVCGWGRSVRVFPFVDRAKGRWGKKAVFAVRGFGLRGPQPFCQRGRTLKSLWLEWCNLFCSPLGFWWCTDTVEKVCSQLLPQEVHPLLCFFDEGADV